MGGDIYRPARKMGAAAAGDRSTTQAAKSAISAQSSHLRSFDCHISYYHLVVVVAEVVVAAAASSSSSSAAAAAAAAVV